jgi:hypothetical protein
MCAGYEEMSTKHHTNEHYRQHIGKTNKRGTRQDMEKTDKNKDKDMTKRKAGHDKRQDKTRQTRHLVPY